MWKNIEINLQNVESNNGKSALIKMPNKSEYAGYKFWHPSKLVRSGSNGYAVSLGYTDEFKFKLKKYGNGRYNKFDVINEIEIGVEEFEKAFNCMEDCTRSKNDESYLIVQEPEKIDKEVEVDEELKNENELECSECTKDLVENGYL